MLSEAVCSWVCFEVGTPTMFVSSPDFKWARSLVTTKAAVEPVPRSRTMQDLTYLTAVGFLRSSWVKVGVGVEARMEKQVWGRRDTEQIYPLRWLCWHGFNFKSIPKELPLRNLVALDMSYSKLERVWEGTKSLGALKFLNLSYSRKLMETTDFSGFRNLERLILKGCQSLLGVGETIGFLERLALLNLEDCKNLRKFPKNISMLQLLETLIISGCSNLEVFPTELTKMESLKVLHAYGYAMKSLSTIRNGPWFPQSRPHNHSHLGESSKGTCDMYLAQIFTSGSFRENPFLNITLSSTRPYGWGGDVLILTKGCYFYHESRSTDCFYLLNLLHGISNHKGWVTPTGDSLWAHPVLSSSGEKGSSLCASPEASCTTFMKPL
ncbi:hypothetical protein RJ640_009481 [Escallonia rubra]|uniref:Uncharacterized protein n=1 Tax=Escallonia rubra TaxID=112253 RepID=A0AA88S0F3_9ASTE|nr:hypothetical protein RJ640_009481 [Escallonia rubra]